MTRTELINEIARRTCFTRKETREFVKAYENLIIETVNNGDPVFLYGFMQIDRRIKKGYVSHNFSNEEIIIPDHEYVCIRPGKGLTKCVKQDG